jgi:hypothetical protein
MGPVLLVARMRLRRRALAVGVGGLLLGLGFGLSLACVAAARTTASAHDRILAAAEAPDAAIALNTPPERAEPEIAAIPGVLDQRSYAGFTGRAAGVEPIYTLALLAGIHDRFPVELPVLRAGRLPNPARADEVFVNATAADGAGIEVGQRLDFTFIATDPGRAPARQLVTVVGIGTFPLEMLTDKTALIPVTIFTRAFYESHRDYMVYGTSQVDLAEGVDEFSDLAPAVAKHGHELQATRAQEKQRVRDALQPTIGVLLALGALAFVASTVAAAQIVQRQRDRWSVDNARLVMTGMTRAQVRCVQLAAAAAVAVVAAVAAVVVMLIASPVAPLGPLRAYDPGQGFGLDGTVAVVGAALVVSTIELLALVVTPLPNRAVADGGTRAARLVGAVPSVMGRAGLALAFRTDRDRGRLWRVVAATTIATMLFAVTATFVVAAVALTGHPARFGFNADLIAINQYGDQSERELATVFGDAPEVAAATAYTSAALRLNGQAVPGIATTKIKGELHPTLLLGRAPRAVDEIVVGQDTLARLGLDLGRPVEVALSSLGSEGRQAAARPSPMRIVGVATFPPVQRAGTDVPRLGTGALLTHDGYLRLRGPAGNEPEFTVARLVPGATVAAVRARAPGGFTDEAQSTTVWLTDAKPAEVVQLDLVMPYLRGAIGVGFAILALVVVHGLWSLVRGSARDLFTLRALGSTPRQLDQVTAWQAAPFAVVALLVGLPVGVAAGRWSFMQFARSLAVVEDASLPPLSALALVGAVALALVLAVVGVAVVVRRRPVTLRLLED